MNAVDLVREVQAYLGGYDGSLRQLARNAGVTPSTLGGVNRADWNPTAATLHACVTAVRAASPDRYDTPIDDELPARFLMQPHNSVFKKLLDAWAVCDRVIDERSMDAARDLGMIGRLSAVRTGHDNRIYVMRYGPATFGPDFQVANRLLVDLPDRRFARFAEQRMWLALRRNEPYFASCIVPIDTAIGHYVAPYTALLLPCRAPGEEVADIVVSISRLEPSAYRDRVQLAEGAGGATVPLSPYRPGRAGQGRLSSRRRG